MGAKIVIVIIILKNLVKKTSKLPCFVSSCLVFNWLILCKNKIILGPGLSCVAFLKAVVNVADKTQRRVLREAE